MKRLAILTTHPIQYYAPLFAILSKEPNVTIKVFYTLGQQAKHGIEDLGFGKKINWDLPLLQGYEYTFLENNSENPNTRSFFGINNPDIIGSIKSFSPTHLLVFGWSFISHLKVMWYFKGKIPVIFRGDSTLLDEKPGLRTILRRILLTWVYRHIDFALYVGQNNKSYYLKHGVGAYKLIFAPHAIDNERFGADEHFDHEADHLRQELGIKSTDIVFLFIGKFEQKKNPSLLINTFKKLKQQNVKLLLVGNGHLEQHLRGEAENFDNIIILPFQNQLQMPVIYRLGNVLVLPSDGPGETWGLCINEAMASGLSVIASDKVGCANDLVKDNGTVFSAGNAKQLYDILNLYTSLPLSEIKNKGIKSKSIIQHWSYEQVVKAIIQVMSVG